MLPDAAPFGPWTRLNSIGFGAAVLATSALFAAHEADGSSVSAAIKGVTPGPMGLR
jgi:hypothetical protein